MATDNQGAYESVDHGGFDAAARASGAISEFLTFRLSGQEFCIDIMSVREIRGWTKATLLPHTPSYVRGVINLRGTVLPIIDLAERIGFPPIEITARQVIVVVQLRGQLVGLLVDAVSDVLTQPREKIQPTPDVAAETVKAFVQGMMALEGRMIGVINLESILPEDMEDAA